MAQKLLDSRDHFGGDFDALFGVRPGYADIKLAVANLPFAEKTGGF
jgi:hypothetical protein